MPATEFTLLWNMKICCNIQVIIYQFLVCSIVLILFLLFYFLVTLRVLTSDKPDPVGPRGDLFRRLTLGYKREPPYQGGVDIGMFMTLVLKIL